MISLAVHLERLLFCAFVLVFVLNSASLLQGRTYRTGGGVGHKPKGSPLSMKDLPREVLYEIALSSTKGSAWGATWLKRQTLHKAHQRKPSFHLCERTPVWPGSTEPIAVFSLTN